MPSDNRSASGRSRRSYRSISSRKSDRRSRNDSDSESDSDSDSSDSNSDTNSDDSSDDNSDDNSGSESERSDNWQDDYNTSDSDSYYSGREKKKGKSKKKRDEEKGSDSSDDDSTGSNSDDDNSVGSDNSQQKENNRVRSTLIAIGLTSVLVILIITGIVLGIVLSRKKNSANETAEVEDTTQVNAVTPPPTAAATVNGTQAPSASPSSGPSARPTAAPDPSEQPTLIVITGDNVTGDDDFFNPNEIADVVDIESKIPDALEITPNGDNFVVTMSDGTPFKLEAGAPSDLFGSSTSLLVQSRNSLKPEDAVVEKEDGRQGGSNSTSDIDAMNFTNAKSYALFNFYMGDLPWFEKSSDLLTYEVEAFVCLQHIPSKQPEDTWGNPQFNNNGEGNRKIFSICRLKNALDLTSNTPIQEGKVGTGEDVERIASDAANYNMPEDCIGEKYTDFFVAPNTTQVCVDVSDFVKSYSPFVPEEEEDSSSPASRNRNLRRRNLQPDAEFDDIVIQTLVPGGDDLDIPDQTAIPTDVDEDGVLRGFTATQTVEPIDSQDEESPVADVPVAQEQINGDAETIVDASNYKNLLFMVANIREDQDASAKFYSRQSVVNATSLFLGFQKVTSAPTASANPTAPTVSPGPTDAPTKLDSPVAPTVVLPPTLAPSRSQSPTTSPAPTYKALYQPCGMCGNFPSFVPLDELSSVVVPLDLAPPQLASRALPGQNATATCNELESLCLDGHCSPTLCLSLLDASNFCGCLAPVQDPCNVCAEDEVLEEPENRVALSAAESPLGEATTTTCRFWEGYCAAGFCNPEVCELVQNDNRCSCRSSDPSEAPSVSPAPTTAEPSATPTISMSPTFKAEYERCSICGGDKLDFLLQENVEVPIAPAEVAPPQVGFREDFETGEWKGYATCKKLEELCEAGYCQPNLCEIFSSTVSLQEDCGCFNGDNIFARNVEEGPSAMTPPPSL